MASVAIKNLELKAGHKRRESGQPFVGDWSWNSIYFRDQEKNFIIRSLKAQNQTA